MPATTAYIRPLDRAAIREIDDAATALINTSGSTQAQVDELAATFGDRVRDHCRPVDTDAGLFVLRGLELDDDELGPTPQGWQHAVGRGQRQEQVLLLLTSAMGRPIAWPGQQSGRFVHDIVPAPGHEELQTGASSSTLLTPHTEDAFHPDRAHLLMLTSLRNHDHVATTAASVRRVRLDDADVDLLTEAVVPILPDDAYGDARDHAAPPPAVPTLFRSGDGLTMRFDPAYTPLQDAGDAYRDAYARLSDELERVSMAVDLRPGDVLVVDNDIVVHGRVPFRARYDGTDRWLKRASVRVDGRRSRPDAEQQEHGYGQRVLVAGEAA